MGQESLKNPLHYPCQLVNYCSALQIIGPLCHRPQHLHRRVQLSPLRCHPTQSSTCKAKTTTSPRLHSVISCVTFHRLRLLLGTLLKTKNQTLPTCGLATIVPSHRCIKIPTRTSTLSFKAARLLLYSRRLKRFAYTVGPSNTRT